MKLNGRKKDTVEQNNTEIILSDQELRKLQLDLLEMLIEVDRICRKYQIAYSLDGGSLLGAVRHGGFIPWDDDVDVIMRRKEYQRFIKRVKENWIRNVLLCRNTGQIRTIAGAMQSCGVREQNLSGWDRNICRAQEEFFLTYL